MSLTDTTGTYTLTELFNGSTGDLSIDGGGAYDTYVNTRSIDGGGA